MKKVNFGLKNAHYAVVTETTEDATGEVTSTYGTVKAWPGIVNITLDAQGESNPFYADDGIYYEPTVNNGYSGDIEIADVPVEVLTDVYGRDKDTNGVVTESNSDKSKYVALLFECNGDPGGRRHVLYRCKLGRPSIAAQTTGESVDVQTQTVPITASPRPDDGKVHARVDKDDAAFAGWYDSVYVSGGSDADPEG